MSSLASLSFKHQSHCAIKYSHTSEESLANTQRTMGGDEERFTGCCKEKPLSLAVVIYFLSRNFSLVPVCQKCGHTHTTCVLLCILSIQIHSKRVYTLSLCLNVVPVCIYTCECVCSPKAVFVISEVMQRNKLAEPGSPEHPS